MPEGSTWNEQELLSRARAGEFASFGILVRHYQARLYALAFQLTGSADDAAEAVQETFLRALRSLAQFQQKAAFYTWLVRILMNHVHDTRARASRQAAHLADQAQQMLRTSQAAEILERNDPVQAAEKTELVQLLWQAVDLLDADLKETLLLREVEQLSYRQIADMMRISEGTVKSRLFRAREALREIMKSQVRE